MREPFAEMLTVGGKSNSLGRVDEVIKITLTDKGRLDELYGCMFEDDAWVRMRAADAFEKICRVHPEWIEPYLDRISKELATSQQPSILWHLAQIYRQVELSAEQKEFVIQWLKQQLSSPDIDWIVSSNCMDTMAQFVQDGSVSESDFRSLIEIQLKHKSKAVVKRANKLLEKFA